MHLRRNVARTLVPLLSVGLLMTACSSATDTTSASGKSGKCTSGHSLDDVYAATKGQTGQQYEDTLYKLAKDEPQPFGFYHSGTFEQEVAAFEKKYSGLKVGDYEATSERVMERAKSEHKAGRVSSAVLLGGDTDLDALAAEDGAIAKLETPTRSYLKKDQQGDTWVSPMGIMQMPTYNAKGMSASDVPKNWVDFFNNFNGKIGIELTDWPWFSAIVTRYLMGEKKMSEKDAIALVTKGLHHAQTVDGHTLVGSLLASNQYDFVPNAYAQYIPDLQKNGAPVKYPDPLPADLPPAYIQLGMGPTTGTCQAASGLLLIDFFMSKEGQDIIASRDYVAPSSTYEGKTLLDQYPNALISKPVLEPGQTEQQADAEWEKKYDDLVRTIGGKPLTQ